MMDEAKPPSPIHPTFGTGCAMCGQASSRRKIGLFLLTSYRSAAGIAVFGASH